MVYAAGCYQLTARGGHMKRMVLVGVVAGALAAGQSGWAGQAAPTGEVDLGSVRLLRAVMVDGTRLAAGTYQLRVTAEPAAPAAAGSTAEFERYVEFRRGGKVSARTVATIVPGSEIKEIAESRIPGPGQSRVELLKGGDYVRIWVNRGGTHYLIHLPPA